MVARKTLVHFLPDYDKNKTLDGLITDHLHQPKPHRERLEKYAELIKRHLLAFEGNYEIEDIILSGSLAKGTALQKHADVDMVVFFKHLFHCYETEEEVIRSKRRVLDRIDIYLRGRCTIPKWLRRMELISDKNSYYLLSYQIFIMDDTFEFDFKIDVLPAVNILNISEQNPISAYNKMLTMDENVRNHYSVSFAVIQKKLIKPIPTKYKDFIRLLKYWKHENFLNLRSYACELLALYIFKRKQLDGTNDLFVESMVYLSCCDNLQITFNECYDVSHWYAFFPPKPYIMDPANPFMNVLSNKPSDINSIKSCAHRTLLAYGMPDAEIGKMKRRILRSTKQSSKFYQPKAEYNSGYIAVPMPSPEFTDPYTAASCDFEAAALPKTRAKTSGTCFRCLMFFIVGTIVVFFITIAIIIVFLKRHS